MTSRRGEGGTFPQSSGQSRLGTFTNQNPRVSVRVRLFLSPTAVRPHSSSGSGERKRASESERERATTRDRVRERERAREQERKRKRESERASSEGGAWCEARDGGLLLRFVVALCCCVGVCLSRRLVRRLDPGVRPKVRKGAFTQGAFRLLQSCLKRF